MRLLPISLVRERRDFRLLFFATLGSSLGTWLAFIALVVDVYDRTGSATWVGALLLAEFVPIVVLGVFAAPFVDRLPRRSILIASDLARAAIFLVLPLAGSASQIIVLALLAGVATSFFRPAAYAGLPNLVSEAELPRANGLIQSAENLTIALGPLAGGVLVAVGGSDPAYLVNGASFALSALLILRIRGTLETERGPSLGHWRDLREGLSLVRRSKSLLAVLIVWSGIVTAANAGVNVAEVVLAKEVFAAGDFGFGLLAASAGLGLVIGSLTSGAVIERLGIRRPYQASLLLMALGIGAAALAPGVWVAAIFVAFSGIGNGIAVVCNATLIQAGAPDRLRGRAFMLLMSFGAAVLGLAMFLSGFATDLWGARVTWGIAAGLYLCAAVASLALLRGVDEPARGEQDLDPHGGVFTGVHPSDVG